MPVHHQVLRSPAGYDLPARLHHPKGSGPFPGVLLCPGGLDGAASLESLQMVLSAPQLAREGYAALAWTPSGREGAPGNEDYNGPLHQEEAAVALRALLRDPRVDPTRVVVLSISFGLVQAMGALTRHPDLAAQVRGLIDWEGPGHRRWLRLSFRPPPAFFVPREAVRMAPHLTCPYRRFQTELDHVHGPRPDIGLEMAHAVANGICPDVRLNDARPPFHDVHWEPATRVAQAKRLLAWVDEWTNHNP